MGSRDEKAESSVGGFFSALKSWGSAMQKSVSGGTETEEQVQKRLRNAKAELEQGRNPGLYDHILVNDDLETCYKNLKDAPSSNRKRRALSESEDEGGQPSAPNPDLSPTGYKEGSGSDEEARGDESNRRSAEDEEDD